MNLLMITTNLLRFALPAQLLYQSHSRLHCLQSTLNHPIVSTSGWHHSIWLRSNYHPMRGPTFEMALISQMIYNPTPTEVSTQKHHLLYSILYHACFSLPLVIVSISLTPLCVTLVNIGHVLQKLSLYFILFSLNRLSLLLSSSIVYNQH
eukprot:sb/3473567/